MEYIKICPICGRRFWTTSSKGKYCSSLCRKRAFRERTRSEAEAEAEAEEQAEADKWQKEKDRIAKQHRDELEAAAVDGDPMAIMMTTSKTSAAYWDAFAAYEVSYAEEYGKTSTAEVNGISVYADNFGDEVVRSIEEYEGITIGR